jgi:CRP-like cAMP-binding protein
MSDGEMMTAGMATTFPLLQTFTECGGDPALAEACQHGAVREVRRGESLHTSSGEPVVTLVAVGVARRTHSPARLSMAMVEPGDVLGFNALAGFDGPAAGYWLTDGVVIEAPVEAVRAAMNPSDLLSAGLKAEGRIRARLEAEFGCAVRCRAVQRLARWLLVLAPPAASQTVHLGQSELAEMAGLQRTSVCSALAQLRREGALKVTRGRILIRDRKALEVLACGCSYEAAATAP